MHPLLLILLTLVVSVTATVIALNFTSGEMKIERIIEQRYNVDDSQILRAMGVLLGPALVPGNQVKSLVNGDEIFPAMLQSIRGAQKTITFETFIYWTGDIGKSFGDALSERARAGVRVHLLLDWEGSVKMEAKYLDQMEAAGVEIRQ